MTQSDFHQLSLEQQLKLEWLKMKMQSHSTDLIKSQNVDVYREMIEMENYYKKLIKEKWGLDNGTK
jgi:hypothetical protein